ncbi:sugar phosphate isomerase/epimerase family protein [Rubinisphaera brasiliensis]|uniref:Xylose isomerase domain-containing protein TIM barrel n=1 Tax=Rubinisphaera brasiliensis (strain ATCC 49424 / DSM 5305 / JCM 21570 / IAM 15109 / NBRC 103401 / IFAM 1448) TaxID=756272 RepID=F0SLM4_RUBBR|nr:sugar phosphate isomerase/epimerase [Rubinisphaera brasiliensis]ADY57707.1 Xylose isomerase domain-containing protein TIM barrel [Rubinisphaera brasiliensis DSM 5305]
MKFGMNLLLWTATVTEEHFPLLEDVKSWGYDGVELPMFDFDLERNKKVGAKLDELGLGRTAVTVCTAEENPISPDPAIRQAGLARLKSAIDACQAAGATHLCGPIHSALGEFTGQGRTEDEWDWAKEILSQAADYAAQANVTLVAEYLNRFECYFLNCAEDCAKFCREVNHPSLKMMYDSFHANIEEKNIHEAIQACKDQMVHVHISENDRSTPGEGNIRWDETFAALKEVNYDGWMTIEAFGLALPELAAATRIWRRMYPSEEHLAKEGLAFMKGKAGA